MMELEEIRKKIRNRYILFMVIIVMTLSLVFLLFFKKISNLDFLPVILMITVILELILVICFVHKLKIQYRKIFKETFVVQSLNKLFTNSYYNPLMGIPYQLIAATNMMYMGDRYHSEDYISGEYKGIKFVQADVHIEQKHETTDSEGHTSTTYVTIFKGRWLVFDFNKTFKADVQISQKGFGNSKVKSFLGKKEERFKRVNLESESFNKKFRVYAQDEHDAFYLITPFLMERIERLVKNSKDKFLFCFINNKLHVGINNGKDSFEPTGVFKKIDIEKIMTCITSDIRVITQFVDELNLDNDLFKKEV